MDEKVQLSNFIVLGTNGFIGSNCLKHLSKQNEKIFGVSRNYIVKKEKDQWSKIPRTSQELFAEIGDEITENTIIINAIWTNNQNNNRDSKIHLDCAREEIALITKLQEYEVRYLSFGSIAEIDDAKISPSRSTIYAEAKKEIQKFLSDTPLSSMWLRIASCYGPDDKRDWFMTQIISSWRKKETIRIDNPQQLINLCHIQSVIKASISHLQTGVNGTFNLASNQWLTLNQIKLAFDNLSEPIYSSITSGPFSQADIQTLEVHTPSIATYFAEIKKSQRS